MDPKAVAVLLRGTEKLGQLLTGLHLLTTSLQRSQDPTHLAVQVRGWARLPASA